MNFELRKWQEDFAEPIAQYVNNKKVADNLRNAFPYPYTLENAKWYANYCITNGEEKQCCRAIVVDGKAVGNISVQIKDDIYCKSAEMGYWLGEPFWNKGIITKAIMQMCEFAFENYDIVRIFAEPFAHNIASRKALVKAGFKLEGVLEKSVYKNGEFYDSCIYALIK